MWRGDTRRILIFPLVVVVMIFIFACSYNRGQKNYHNYHKIIAKGDKKMIGKVRKSAVSGMFYPGSERALRQTVKEFMDSVDSPQIEARLLGLIVPHAGYQYSGQVAAYAYKQLQGRSFNTVILIGPSHYIGFEGISVASEDFWETPIGRVAVDTTLAQRLVEENDKIMFYPSAHQREHSLEVQLPFLQEVLGDDFQILPLVIGNQSYQNCELLRDALVKILKQQEGILLVASTDLSHYYPYDVAVNMDKTALKEIERLSPEELNMKLEKGICQLCGSSSVLSLLLIAKEVGARRVEVLKYANSGDVTGDKSRVVGYAAIAIYYEDISSDKKEHVEESVKRSFTKVQRSNKEEYTEEEKHQLIEIALQSIQNAVNKREISLKEWLDIEKLPASLKQKKGAFVTIKKQNQLRGCIGYIEAEYPLYLTVHQAAIAAATRDFRFSPVSPEELKQLSIEISILSPLEKVEDIQQIEIGRHGLMIRKGFHSGLLLPQVATEHHLDRVKFLEQTCLKAGLNRDEWKQKGTELYMFSAFVFGEE